MSKVEGSACARASPSEVYPAGGLRWHGLWLPFAARVRGGGVSGWIINSSCGEAVSKVQALSSKVYPAGEIQ